MGAGQSSNGHDGGAGGDVKTSYYELLGIPRQATEDEIKKAYRRKALELHPDRNYGNEEAATKTFAEIQAAYEVLSDPQERAWYDSHESAILRGEDVADGDAPSFENVRMTTADDLARLVRKFNSNIDFSDAPTGFFGFLKDTFDQLAKEEEIAADWDNTEPREYPIFGHRDDDYDDVVKQFYVAWSNFSTAKNFSWKDKYRLSEAPDRWTRRRMEQENGRLRQEGKREFNEAVRSLVAFIKKRDPRYVPNTQSEAERQQVLRDAAAAQAARARAANEAKLSAEVPEWTKLRDPEECEESEEEEVEEEVLECVACNKIFKSERQWEAHEKSKKHQKAIRSLQQKMRRENATLDLTGAGDHEDSDEEDEQRVEHETAEEIESEQDLDLHNNLHETAEDDSTNNVIRPTEGATQSDDTAETSESEDEDYASIQTIQARMNTVGLDTPSTVPSDEGEDGAASRTAKPKLGKAKQKRAKKAAAAAVTTPESSDTSHMCAGCNVSYPSKTQLFQHLKENPKHAAVKAASPGGGKGKKRNGKR